MEVESIVEGALDEETGNMNPSSHFRYILVVTQGNSFWLQFPNLDSKSNIINFHLPENNALRKG